MRLPAALLLVCLLLAGCRRESLPASAEPPPTRVGPSLERLCEVLGSRDRAATEKEAYWRSARGKLIRGTGTVLRVSERLTVECPLKDGRKVQVTARPSPAAASGLSELKQGEPIQVLGRLSGEAPEFNAPTGYAAAFELTDARIAIPMR